MTGKSILVNLNGLKLCPGDVKVCCLTLWLFVRWVGQTAALSTPESPHRNEIRIGWVTSYYLGGMPAYADMPLKQLLIGFEYA